MAFGKASPIHKLYAPGPVRHRGLLDLGLAGNASPNATVEPSDLSVSSLLNFQVAGVKLHAVFVVIVVCALDHDPKTVADPG